MRWLDGITDAMDMNLGKLREMVRDREAGHAVVQQRVGHALATEQQQPIRSALPLDVSVLRVNQLPISHQIHSLSKYLLFLPLNHLFLALSVY